MKLITIFLEQTYRDNEELINESTRCGNLERLYLAPNIYWAAKATTWEDTIMVNDSSEMTAAFRELNSLSTESLTMSIELYVQLRSKTEVTDEETGRPITDEETGLQINTFDEEVTDANF